MDFLLLSKGILNYYFTGVNEGNIVFIKFNSQMRTGVMGAHRAHAP